MEIVALVTAVLGLATVITKNTLSNKADRQGQIQNLMYEFVEEWGYSLDDMKMIAPMLYKKETVFFEYEYYKAIDIYNARNDNKELINRGITNNIQTILIVVIIALAIYYVVNK